MTYEGEPTADVRIVLQVPGDERVVDTADGEKLSVRAVRMAANQARQDNGPLAELAESANSVVVGVQDAGAESFG